MDSAKTTARRDEKHLGFRILCASTMQTQPMSTGGHVIECEYYSGTRLAQNGQHEYTKNIVLKYYSSTDFPVLVLVCSVLAPALVVTMAHLNWSFFYVYNELP